VVFGGVTGATSAVKSVTLINKTKTMLPLSVSASGDFQIVAGGAAEVSDAAASVCGASLAPRARCAVKLTFTPSAFGTLRGFLMADGLSLAKLSGTGAHGPIGISPKSLNFKKVAVGTPSTKTVTLTNDNPVGLVIDGIGIQGDAADYSASQNCVETIPSGGTCQITVSFTPGSKGTKKAKLLITDAAAGSPQKASLSGTGQ
jgi:hypothetical protein